MTPMITFPAPASLPYLGGCSSEPAFFALDSLVHYRADMVVGAQHLPQVVVLDTLRAVLADPAAYGVTREAAEEARQSFLELAGQALTAQGGQVAWLEREFQR
ncbi:hypothetical protein FNU79_15530 [Deinococcus detaillensis]|uniref:Uncharacterized protein n=1 Tax=Deinococcus detaillensis TaxID=2592048 RepID=A0A553ULS0_9DEIO|nr:hypothetical protein [Deinococcus detaillensis]TSA81144.1 hypothetical protein FNU79_15530 [Deinococcus detaillensis]